MVGRAIKLLSCVVLMLSATARNVPAGRSILPFTDDLDQALEQAASAGKPVVLVFIAVWCPNCQRMEKTTFTDPVIARHADDLVWVMVDIDRHLALAHQYNVEAVPVTFLLDPGGQRRASLVGLVGAAQLDAQLATMLEQEAPTGQELSGGVNPQTHLIWGPHGYRSKSICFSHVGYGPLNLPSRSPFQSLRLGIRPRVPSTLSKGQFEVSGSATNVNIWAPNDDFSWITRC